MNVYNVVCPFEILPGQEKSGSNEKQEQLEEIHRFGFFIVYASLNPIEAAPANHRSWFLAFLPDGKDVHAIAVVDKQLRVATHAAI
jgi:hypothetical protein